MLHKTRAIILKQTNYSESSIIIQAFTEKFGLQSYLVNGARKPKAKIRAGMMQPLHLLELVVYHRENQRLQRIAEARLSPLFQSIPYDIAKSTVALFLNETLYKCLRHQTPDEPLFQFIYNAVSWLDSAEKMPGNFHLYFLLKLSRFLGFHPAAQKTGQHFFDLKDGVFCSAIPAHPFVLEDPYTRHFSRLLLARLDELPLLRIPPEDRRVLLKKTIDYYRLHIDNFGEMKSHQILEQVLA